MECSDCGKIGGHFYPWYCPRDLHGKEDPFKTSCAWCGEVIPSGADREADKFGNLYCDTDCLAEGYAELFDRVVEQQESSARA